jgi:hypothetical protein
MASPANGRAGMNIDAGDECACSVMIRGSNGIPCRFAHGASRKMVITKLPGKPKDDFVDALGGGVTRRRGLRLSDRPECKS